MEITDNNIELDKTINKLDDFVIKTTQILEKHVKYVLVSGYVSILFGRSRATEDVDVLIEHLDLRTVKKLLNDYEKNGYYCINTHKTKEAFELLNTGHAIRIAKKNVTIPNLEIKIARNELAKTALNNTIKLLIGKQRLIISKIELQIQFKKLVLKSPKDLEDAYHLETYFKDYINPEKLKEYKLLIDKYEN